MSIKIGTSDIKDIYVGTGTTNYRYLRWTITANRNNINVTQMSEFEICNSSGTKMARPSGTTITGNIVGPGSETVDKLIDGSTSTKYCPNGSLPIIITITLGSTVDFSIYNKYKRYTANDESGRDPKSWTIEASNDGSNWTKISSVSNATITTNRYSLAGTWSFTTKGNVSAVYVGTTKVRPAEWKPGANTIAYYPLTSTTTVNDLSGNNYNFTGSATFGVDEGVDCYQCRSNSNILKNNYSIIYGKSNITMNMWLLQKSTVSRTQLVVKTGADSASQQMFLYFISSASKLYASRFFNDYDTGYTVPTGQRFNLCATHDGTNRKTYINGNLINTWATSLNIPSSGNTSLGYATYSSGTEYFNGNASKLIWEDKIRTAQEISDYYNLTKGNYGL